MSPCLSAGPRPHHGPAGAPFRLLAGELGLAAPEAGNAHPAARRGAGVELLPAWWEGRRPPGAPPSGSGSGVSEGAPCAGVRVLSHLSAPICPICLIVSFLRGGT